MKSHETEGPRPQITIDAIAYNLVLERQRGVGIYANADRSRYLRVGDSALVAKELGFHKRLLEMGFPVAQIIQEGEVDGQKYWIEESLGDGHLSARFRKETETQGEIAEDSFCLWLQQVMAMRNAQARTAEARPYDFDALAHAVGEDGMEDELPDLQEKIRAAWKKARNRIANLPICLTHGDFTSHNTMEHGIIDFGDHFEGPLGYDLVTAITVPFWFPKDHSYEFFQGYNFSPKQIERVFSDCRVLETPQGIFDLNDYFDDLFFLKANWWAVRNHRMPKLQEWRYERFRTVVDRYLAGESLREYWQNECSQ